MQKNAASDFFSFLESKNWEYVGELDTYFDEHLDYNKINKWSKPDEYSTTDLILYNTEGKPNIVVLNFSNSRECYNKLLYEDFKNSPKEYDKANSSKLITKVNSGNEIIVEFREEEYQSDRQIRIYNKGAMQVELEKIAEEKMLIKAAQEEKQRIEEEKREEEERIHQTKLKKDEQLTNEIRNLIAKNSYTKAAEKYNNLHFKNTSLSQKIHSGLEKYGDFEVDTLAEDKMNYWMKNNKSALSQLEAGKQLVKFNSSGEAEIISVNRIGRLTKLTNISSISIHGFEVRKRAVGRLDINHVFEANENAASIYKAKERGDYRVKRKGDFYISKFGKYDVLNKKVSVNIDNSLEEGYLYEMKSGVVTIMINNIVIDKQNTIGLVEKHTLSKKK
jgi:hypothetical protein